MKKILITIMFLLVIFLLYKKSDDTFTIPKESIRFRIIANSNDFTDQLMKENLRKHIEPIINNMLNDTKDVNDARAGIKDNLDELTIMIETFLKDNRYDIDFNIKYGDNYFPKKAYKGILYEEGNYESLVITLGKGEGNNWWCLLFPPLCYADFDDAEEVEYKLLIKQIFDKIK